MADDWLQDWARKKRGGAAHNVTMQGRDPAKVAQARKYAEEFGVSPAAAEEDPVYEELSNQKKVDATLAENPWMIPKLQDPDFAAMVTPDSLGKIGNLTSAFGMTQPTEKYSLGMKPNYAKLLPDVSGVPAAPRAPQAPIPNRAVRTIKTMGAIYGTTVQNIIGAAAGVAENVTDAAGLNDKLEPFYRKFEEDGRKVAEGLEDETPWITPGTKRGVFSGLVSLNTMGVSSLGGAGAVLPLLTGMTYGSAYQKYQGRGNSIGMSMVGSGMEAAVEWATERGPLGFLTKGMKGGLKDFMTQYVLGDFAGEQIATGLQSLTEEAIKPNGPERTLKEWLLDPQRGKDAWETLVATTVMAGAVGGGGLAMRRLTKTSNDMVDTTDGLIGQTLLDQAMERAADNIELKTNSPEDFAKFVNAGAAQSPVKNVYIPIEAIEAALADETLPEEERAALTFYQSQIEEARLNQSEVVIPIGDALASFAGTKVWQSLKDDARVLAGGISGREARTKMEGLVAELEAVGNQAIEEARSAAPATKAKAGVFNEVKAQMVAAGRSEKEAQTTAVLYASRAENLASERYGQFKTVDDAWKWMQLQIVGPDAKVGKGKKLKQSGPASVNVGLETNDGGTITEDQVLAAFEKLGLKVGKKAVQQSNTEQTLIAQLDRPLTNEEAYSLSVELRQDAIAHHDGGRGHLDGPNKANFGNVFNPEYFMDLEGKTSVNENATWSPERLAELIAKYEQADGSTSAVVVTMTPDEYLGALASERGVELLEERVKGMPDVYGKGLDLNVLRASGPPSITIRLPTHPGDRTKGAVFGHDGRHRVTMMKLAGVKSMPVLIHLKDAKGKTYFTKEPVVFDNVLGNRSREQVDNGHLKVSGTGIPLSEKFKGQLEGDGAQTFFQSDVAEDTNGFPAEDVLVSKGNGTLDPTTRAQFGGIVQPKTFRERLISQSATLTGQNDSASFMVRHDEQIATSQEDNAGSDAEQSAAGETDADPSRATEDGEQLELYPGVDFGIDPSFFGSTIEVDGKDRVTTNADGQPIAQSRKAVENFWRWFGDSAAVDDDGRPIVFYHGSRAQQFDIFEGEGRSTFFFSKDKATAESFQSTDGGMLVSAYLRVDTVDRYDAEGRMWDAVIEQDYEGYEMGEATDRYVVDRMDGFEASGSVDETEITDADGTRTVFRVDHPNENEGAEFTDEGEAEDRLVELQDEEREKLEERVREEVEWYELEELGYLETNKQSTDDLAAEAFGSYDAVWIDDVDEGSGPSTVVIVLGKPRAIKSTTNYGSFDPENPSMFRQGPRGAATFAPSGETVVQLFGKADFSTMLHETSHVFLQQEFTLARHESASAELKADVAALTKWMIANGGALDANGMPNREAHELFARTGERYFREGKAPSVELRPAFTQFKSWLESVYKSIKSLLAHGPAPINPEIREIMDRMIATEDAIEANATQPMSQEDLGMSEAEYGAYLDSVKTAKDTAYDTLLERMMKAIRRRETQKGREQRANVRAAIAEEVNARPEFIALHLLRTGRWLGDPSRERQDVKLNTGWLLDNYGDEILGQLPVGLQPLHRGDGVRGDDIADLVGMPSGDALVRALIDLKAQAAALKAEGNPRPLRDQIIEDLTNEEMAERHGDIAMSEEQIEEEAIAALNANRQGEVLATELRQLKKRSGQGVVTPYQLLREWARRKANEGIVSEVASKSVLQRYIRAYNKARNAFENALLDKKPDEAIKQKQAQMINHALLAEGKVVADEINTIVKRMQRYGRTKALASIDQDYMDRIHELIDAYGFARFTPPVSETSFEKWADAQNEEVHVPEGFREGRGPSDTVPVFKLLELNDMVQNLVALGKSKQKIITAQGEQDLAETLDDSEGRILALPPRARGDRSASEGGVPFMTSVRKGQYRKAITNALRSPGAGARWAASGLIKIESLFDRLDGTTDGTGPLNQLAVRGATGAANKYSELIEEVLQPIIDRQKLMGRKQRDRLSDDVTINELTLNVSIHPDDTEKLGKPLTMSRKELLGILLNTGNTSNFEKLLAGEKWSDNPTSASEQKRVRDILLEYTSPEDRELLQATWQGVAKLWPYIVEVERELTGIVPEKVVPIEFEFKGETYTGGYWPVVWDGNRSSMGKNNEDDLMGIGSSVGTPKGHTITRTAATGPIKWDMQEVLTGHLTKVASRIAYAPWVRDTLKVVDNRRITGAIDLRLGKEYRETIKKWMKDQIPSNIPDEGAAKFFGKLLNKTRTHMSIAVLGISATTGMAQTLGLSYSIGILGEGSKTEGMKWVSHGLAKMVSLQKSGALGAQEFVFALSPEMARRAHEVNQEVTRVFRSLRDKDSVYAKGQAAAFWHIGFIDLNMVAIPTWLGGYEKALSQGLSEADAAAYGDKAVRLSQGSGREKDLSEIQRGNAGMKFISMFYTPSSVFFNSQWNAVQDFKAGEYSKALMPTFWFLTVTTLLEALQNGDWPEDDDEDGLGGIDFAEWVSRNMLFGLSYGIPVVRDFANAKERKMRGEYAEYGATPLTFMGQTVERGAKTVGKVIAGEETEGKDLKYFIAAAGYMMALPGNQPGKTAGFIKDVVDGKIEPQGPWGWIRGLVTGKPPEGQEQ